MHGVQCKCASVHPEYMCKRPVLLLCTRGGSCMSKLPWRLSSECQMLLESCAALI